VNGRKGRWLPIFYGLTGKCFLKLIARTCHFQAKGLHHLINTASSEKCILMFWHNRLMMIAEILSRFAPQLKYAALISNSRDGEMIAALTNSYENGRSIRVAHNLRASALRTFVREIKENNEIMIVTPDGPRGPLFEVKPGVIFAASKASAKIIPVTWSATRVWKLSTWDGLLIPKPFSKIQVSFGAPEKVIDSKKKIEEANKLKQALFALEL